MTGKIHRMSVVPHAGARVAIVKLQPDGRERTRYPGVTIAAPDGWVAICTTWGQPRIDAGYLVFEPGDILYEYFSLVDPFNVFTIYTHDGTLKGWYCNVTHPSWVTGDAIFWQDLYLDVIGYPDGRLLVLDEDELAESGIAQTDPDLHQLILNACDRLKRMFREREYPFDQEIIEPDGSEHGA